MIIEKIIREEINRVELKNKTQDLQRKIEGEYDVDLFIYYSQLQNVLVLSSIIIPKEKRGLGIGRKVMEMICGFADVHGLKTLLTPTSEFGGNKEKLIKFYKSLGFKKNKDHRYRELMIREPQ